MEPPFRILARALLKRFSVSVETRALWELSPRPPYLLGVLVAAEQAREQGIGAISVVEFGVAGGEGLVALQREAEAVETATGVTIKVYGFDTGRGLPPLIGDHRDHPDRWRALDYPMDEEALRARLSDRTTLVLGDVNDTVPPFVSRLLDAPIGFVSFDLDLYSSTRQALMIFTHRDRKMLQHTPVYFDDIEFLSTHRYAGELLAIEEFNRENDDVKIDRWYGVRSGRPFPERPFLLKMFVAHDLRQISTASLSRNPAKLPLK